MWTTFSDDHCPCYAEKNPAVGERRSRVHEGRPVNGVRCGPLGDGGGLDQVAAWQSGEVVGAGCVLKVEPIRVVGKREGD